ncbi:MAG: serine/threonine-protein phosphatase [Alistipes sp.]|nr:serine/threonine-protein phosphatase [Alistipes sp.]
MDLKHIKTQYDLNVYAESRIGGRKENQDSFGAADTPYGFLAVVCDGMGGGPAGKLASTIAVEAIIAYIKNVEIHKEAQSPGVVDATNGVVSEFAETTYDVKDASEHNGYVAQNDEKDSQIQDNSDIKTIVRDAIRFANKAIIGRGLEYEELIGMGSTCVLVFVDEDCATIAHVGDSRVYQFRGSKKVFRTFDHSMVFDLVKQKIITEEQARLSAQSNVITKCLGANLALEPEIAQVAYRRGDRFMLTTDGIHGVVPETELISMATNRSASLGQVVDEIATHIDGCGRVAGGGHDNLTIMMVETQSNSKMKSSRVGVRVLYFIIVAILLIISSIALYFVEF